MIHAEVFELDTTLWKQFLHGLHKLVKKSVVGLVIAPFLANPCVQGVVEKSLIVCADVEHNRQRQAWWHSSTRRIQRQFADRNPHAASAKITKTENP